MPSAWKTVRVFISSTFRDMHAERDHLIKVTFPALREKLLPHRVELYDIDLRWGIIEDEAKNEKVIGLCLEQIDDCRPFFLAFLGHRYGWVPDQVPQETQQRFPFLQQFPGVSVTEMELRHGVRLSPKGNFTLVLLRRDDTLATIPDATRNRDFVESDPILQQKLNHLRRELEAGTNSVQRYSANWDPKRYDRVNRGALQMFKEQEAFCRQMDHATGLSQSLVGQALILSQAGDLDGPMRVLKEQEAICRAAKHPYGLAISLVNQGLLLSLNHSRPIEGLPHVEEALRIATEFGLLALAGQLEGTAQEIRAQVAAQTRDLFTNPLGTLENP